MRTSHQIVVTVVIFVLAATNKANALHCWTCATSAIDGQFCRDPFQATGLSEENHQIAYKECPQASGLKPVCKTLRQRINNGLEIRRGCFYRDTHEQISTSCVNDPTPPNVVTLSCEICETDGCNGAKNLAPIYSVIFILPAIVALVFKTLHL